MAVKDDTACYPTEGLIAREPRRHYRTRIKPIHWQLRSIIGVSESNTVYYPAGPENRHIQELNTATQRSETVVYLEFSPRCLVATRGWLCCGGEDGEFVAIRQNSRSSRGEGSNGGDSSSAQETNGDGSRQRAMEDEEYDDFDSRMCDDAPALVTVPPRMIARSQKFGEQRVNCITVWTPPTFVPLHTGAYPFPVAVLANNDKHVTLVNLETAEGLDELDFPDCVNRAVLSPDGRLLASVSDDPFLYIHERVENEDPIGSRHRLNRPNQRDTSQKQYKWKLIARHHLRGQRKEDQSVHRGSFAACFSNTGRYLAIGTQYGIISVFDTSLLADTTESLVACFSSSNPDMDPGAVREMTFCPGPYDLLAWSEDLGAVGVADARDGFVSRQTLQLGDEASYEQVSINEVIRINEELVEERQRRRQQQPSNDSEESLMRNVLAGSTPTANEYDMTPGEQAIRIRDALDRYHMPLTVDETQFLDALQERQRRREQGDQQNAPQVPREQLERERIQTYLGRRSAMLLRARPSLRSQSSGGDNGGNNNGGGASGGSGGGSSSSAAARSRERNESVTMAVNDILGTFRSLRSRESAETESRLPPGLLQPARRSGVAIPTVENEEPISDDDAFSSRVLMQASRRRQQQPWGTMDSPPIIYSSRGNIVGGGNSGLREGGSSTQSADTLHSYTLDAQPLRRMGGLSRNGARRQQGTAIPAGTPAAESGLLDWDDGLTAATLRHARDFRESDIKDSHTAGLAWSDDGTILYVGTEGGIFEFRVNLKGRMFYPSVSLR